MVNKIWTFFFYNLIKIAAADQWLKENVHLKKKNLLTPPMPGPKPGCKRRRVMLQACKSLLSLLKAEYPISVYVSVDFKNI
jgi:hypothetical protein